MRNLEEEYEEDKTNRYCKEGNLNRGFVAGGGGGRRRGDSLFFTLFCCCQKQWCMHVLEIMFLILREQVSFLL